MSTTQVEYVGPKDMHPDGVYGTGQWTPGLVKSVPSAIAAKLLRHVGVWKAAEGENMEAVEMAAANVEPNEEQEIQEINADILRKQINTMDKDKLSDIAEKHFGVKIDKRGTVEALRTRVNAMIDQYGVA